MAESRDDGVVVGPRPLPEQVLQPVHDAFRAARLTVTTQLLLGVVLAATVRVVLLGLDRGREDDFGRLPRGLEEMQQLAGKAGVPGREVLGPLRPVHTGEVEDRVRREQRVLERRPRIPQVVLDDLEIFSLAEGTAQVLANESLRSGYDDPPHSSTFSPRIARWMHSSFIRRSHIPFTSRRGLLCEL